MNMIERYALEAGVFSQRGGGREYTYIFICTRRKIDQIYGNPVSFNENHLACSARITGYIGVTLNPGKCETASLTRYSINLVSRLGFGLRYSDVFSLISSLWIRCSKNSMHCLQRKI